MAWPKGKKRGEKTPGSGRKSGEPNKLSGTAKENIAAVFNGLGGVDAMQVWAKGNPNEFYKLYGRLLPIDTNVSGTIGSYEALPIPVEQRDPLESAGGTST